MYRGVSRSESEPSTGTRALIGNPIYMSPEHIQTDTRGARSDVFSLGIIVYEALTGSRPFAADTPMAELYAIVTIEPPLPSARRREIPEAVDRILLECLSKNPEQRPPADELVRRLEALRSNFRPNE